MMNTPIRKFSLAQEVAEKLGDRIRAGRYREGEQLPTEPELMKQFGVGRSSIREAIRILANSGMLRVQQGVGTFIEARSGIMEPLLQRFKRAGAKDLDEVRQLLEMKIAEKAATNHTQKDIKNIKAMLDRRNAAAKSGDLEACVQADIDFHMSIAQAAGNPILADLYQSFAVHLKSWFLQLYPDTKAFLDTIPVHEELYQSIKARDGAKAWRSLNKIIKH